VSEGKYEAARRLANEALLALKEKGQNRASGQEMVAWVKRNRKNQLHLVEKSWGSFLTRMLEDPESPISREPGKYGYVLAAQPGHEPVQVAENFDATPLVSPGAKTSRERRLYGLLAEWLKAKKYQAEDTSQAKKGGAWGNPDVVGIRCFEGFSSTLHIELV
jgi:hypothetical protein